MRPRGHVAKLLTCYEPDILLNINVKGKVLQQRSKLHVTK